MFSERFQREVNAAGSTHGSRSSKFYLNRRFRGPPAVRNVSTARAREKPGMFLQTASHRGYIKTTTLPPLSRVSPSQNCSHPPVLPQICPNLSQNPEIPSSLHSGPSDRPIQRPRC